MKKPKTRNINIRKTKIGFGAITVNDEAKLVRTRTKCRSKAFGLKGALCFVLLVRQSLASPQMGEEIEGAQLNGYGSSATN